MSARAASLRRVKSSRPAALEAEQNSGRWQRASTRRVALAQFALCGIALLIVVATIGAVALRHVAREEALRDARALTAALSRGVIEPAVTPGVVEGDPAALRRLDRLVHQRVLGPPEPDKPEDSSIVRDQDLGHRRAHRLLRQATADRQALPAARGPPRGARDERKTSADVSDLSGRENRFERGAGRLVEVYEPMLVAGSGQESSSSRPTTRRATSATPAGGS